MDVKGAISDISGATVTGNCIHIIIKKTNVSANVCRKTFVHVYEIVFEI